MTKRPAKTTETTTTETKTAPSPLDAAIAQTEKRMAYVPKGETDEITLTIGTVREFLAVKTSSGKSPSQQDIVKFMMMCKSRGLNPWVGDAYLIGYDGNNGPVFSLITAVQALYKRAEINRNYDGIQSGVIVRDKESRKVTHRKGDYYDLEIEDLVGGWAKVYRKDRKKPDSDSLNLRVYDTKRSQWKKDPAGMICKVAESSALRKAFPSEVGGLYIQAELQAELDNSAADLPTASATAAADPDAPAVDLAAQMEGLPDAKPEKKKKPAKKEEGLGDAEIKTELESLGMTEDDYDIDAVCQSMIGFPRSEVRKLLQGIQSRKHPNWEQFVYEDEEAAEAEVAEVAETPAPADRPYDKEPEPEPGLPPGILDLSAAAQDIYSRIVTYKRPSDIARYYTQVKDLDFPMSESKHFRKWAHDKIMDLTDGQKTLADYLVDAPASD